MCTDATTATAFTNVLTLRTKPLGWYRSMAYRRPDHNQEGHHESDNGGKHGKLT